MIAGKKTSKEISLISLDEKIDELAESTAKGFRGIQKNIEESIDSLAVITKKGFDSTVSKKEFGEFRTEAAEFKEEMTEFKKSTEATLYNLDTHAQRTNERLDAIEKALGPLVQVSGMMQKEIRDLNSRVDRLEHKVGISRS